ncbi:MAG: fused MFS/spermidine synthase [Candidatus Ozemobacteraceae bacterium]
MIRRLPFFGASFLAAFLFFWAQPMVGKRLLPVFGGASAVWGTCLVFFQAILVGGYLLAHLCVKRVSAPRHALLQGILLAGSLFCIPALSFSGADLFDFFPTASPGQRVFLLLLTTIGPPMLILGASSPAIQSWFVHAFGSQTNPYGLYATGNAGSLLGLFAFPLFIEPSFDLDMQARFWCWGIAFLAALFIICYFIARHPPFPKQENPEIFHTLPNDEGTPDPHDLITKSDVKSIPRPLRLRLRHIGLAFLPAALLNAVTNTITTDLAPIPLFWIIPLGLYLLSFVLVFSRWAPSAEFPGGTVSALLLIPALTLFESSISWPLRFSVLYHLIMVSLIFLLFHGTLARERPHPENLTSFYLDLSIGGLLGGIFPAFIAPLIFCTQPEHALLIAAAALMLDNLSPEPPTRKKVPVFLALVMAFLFYKQARIPSITSFGAVVMIWVEALILVLAAFHSRKNFGFLLAFFLVAFSLTSSAWVGPKLLADRNFYGVCRVEKFSDGSPAHMLFHGNICHGAQITDPGQRRLPLTYFAYASPIGRLIRTFQFHRRSLRLAVVGLGAGSLAAYVRPEDHMTFFEIDPKIIRIARDPRLFTYLADCRGTLEVIEGDGRLCLERTKPGQFHLVILDAYSSDAIPIHLMTREALELYLSRLAPGGVLAFHISNRYLNLAPPLSALADALGLQGWEDLDDPDILPQPNNLENRLTFASRWVMLQKPTAQTAGFFTDISWKPLPGPQGFPLWTDRQSAIGSLLTAK